MVPIKKILFPYDFTENASKVIPYLLTMAQKHGASIFVIHVVEDLSRWGAGSYVPHLPLESFQKDAFEGAKDALESFCHTHLASVGHLQKIVVGGDPDMEILKAIEREEIDLVVMGTHGRKGLEHTIFGSVAENVIRKSTVPVLVVNPHTLKR